MWHVLQTQKKLFHRKFIKYIFLFLQKYWRKRENFFAIKSKEAKGSRSINQLYGRKSSFLRKYVIFRSYFSALFSYVISVHYFCALVLELFFIVISVSYFSKFLFVMLESWLFVEFNLSE
jgi:hypothetical protein